MIIPNILPLPYINNNKGDTMKDWQYSMFSAMRVAMKQNHFDLLNLYLKLEKASKKYLESGEMKEGDFFEVPFENGTIFKISFFKDYSTVIAKHYDGTIDNAITKNDSYHKEYRYLIAASNMLKVYDLGIGPRYPKEFENLIRNAKVGDAFRFDNGKLYVCDFKHENGISFVRSMDYDQIPSLKDIDLSERRYVSFHSPLEFQQFFREVKNQYTNSLNFKMTSITEARGILNSLISNIDDTKKLKIGPNWFIIQKSKEDKGLVYYNQNGERISEETMLFYLSWLNASLNKIEIERYSDISPKVDFEDTGLMCTFEEMCNNKDFTKAIQLIRGYCKEHDGVFQLNMSSYVKTNDDYKATSFIIKSENQKVSFYQATHKDDNLSKDIETLTPISELELLSYFETIYNEKYIMIQNEVMQEILNSFPNWKEELIEKYIKEKVDHIMKDTKVFNFNTEIDQNTIELSSYYDDYDDID